ncbi:MAG: hypothetical protein H7Z17_01810 [Fuerstia sp.]|nr:hypothetical protein [Fuerstiella sp.]
MTIVASWNRVVERTPGFVQMALALTVCHARQLLTFRITPAHMAWKLREPDSPAGLILR